jgi:hypothetical protein
MPVTLRQQVVPLAALGLLVTAGLLIRRATSPPHEAPVHQADLPTSTSRPSQTSDGVAARTVVPVRPPVPRLAPSHGTAAPTTAAPIPYGPNQVSLSHSDRRPNEYEPGWKYRVRFVDQYRRFVEEGGLTPEQESNLRRVYADTQIALHLVGSADDPKGLSDSEMNKLELRDLADLQKTLRRRIAEVLAPDQARLLLKGDDYLLLRLINTLGFAPLEITKAP